MKKTAWVIRHKESGKLLTGVCGEEGIMYFDGKKPLLFDNENDCKLEMSIVEDCTIDGIEDKYFTELEEGDTGHEAPYLKESDFEFIEIEWRIKND